MRPSTALLEEKIADLLKSDDMSVLFLLVIAPAIKEWKQSLLTDPELSDAMRKGYIYAMNSMKEAFLDTYRRHKITVPEWVEKEFP